MTPRQPALETDVIGRHGRVGVDVLPHENQALVPVELREVVDQLFESIDHPSRTLESGEFAGRSVPSLETRGAKIAVADTVRIDSVA